MRKCSERIFIQLLRFLPSGNRDEMGEMDGCEASGSAKRTSRRVVSVLE